jgi:CspA family cold shock protein
MGHLRLDAEGLPATGRSGAFGGTDSAYPRHVARGVVKFWNAEKGWGAISSAELPPGRDAWAHYSQIMDMPGYRALEAGQAVEFSYEGAQQDSFDFRVIEVRLTLPE